MAVEMSEVSLEGFFFLFSPPNTINQILLVREHLSPFLNPPSLHQGKGARCFLLKSCRLLTCVFVPGMMRQLSPTAPGIEKWSGVLKLTRFFKSIHSLIRLERGPDKQKMWVGGGDRVLLRWECQEGHFIHRSVFPAWCSRDFFFFLHLKWRTLACPLVWKENVNIREHLWQNVRNLFGGSG